MRFVRHPNSARFLSRKSADLAEMGDDKAALETAQRGLLLAWEEQATALAGEIQALLAFTYRQRGDDEKARLYCQDAIASFSSVNDAAGAQVVQDLLDELIAPGYDGDNPPVQM